MAIKLSRERKRVYGELRYEPTAKRVRARAGDTTVVDSRRAVLVWEPNQYRATYAVPAEDVRGTLTPAEAAAGAHTADGEPLSIEADGVTLAGAAFRPADPDLAGLVLLDFDTFDGWLEEDEAILGHPRDPYHRIDVRRTSTPVRVELDGELLAESTNARVVFETGLSPRYYLPRADVRTELLTPTDTATVCQYKGTADYWAVTAAGQTHPDLVWAYEQPLPDAVEIGGHLCFYDEKVDLFVDGVRR
ncbi:uncharacterized protein (DUF427 family) [Herbihabitans rhizosphaerae]|uniref:Uncharacterized protein (DUF427 family) n=1 Tax=Herbihabitans rhizosphaerae TaxID=1872711 RepID=A0A4Q7KN82_9PSEU|nr:DUF427 domain-containing protein [Herbihabitans rhizosphaerae]RZS37091.1 uncharacterized protein (DUF427 family) [Herbihabitans rhizosphaerae]